jgi:hypothetical protein
MSGPGIELEKLGEGCENSCSNCRNLECSKVWEVVYFCVNANYIPDPKEHTCKNWNQKEKANA